MKQTQLDKHTVAWFKIAECVSRGERERAFGVYRLLSYSFNDDAVARQLEADIHVSFGEQEQAVFLYRQAMTLYSKSERLLEAAGIGEHLVTLLPHDISLRYDIIQIYKSLELVQKMRVHIYAIVDFIAHKMQWHDIKNMVADCASFSDGSNRALMYSEIIIAGYKVNCPLDILQDCIGQALDDLCLNDKGKKSVQLFLSALNLNAEKLHEYAVGCAKK